MSNIDFYFDFFSPYSYLANFRVPGLADKYGYSLTYKPIDLKAAKLAAGNTGPATAQMPAKLRYAIADLTRWAKRYGATFAFAAGAPTSSARINKGTFFAIETGQARDYVKHAYHATFGTGGAFDSDEVLSAIARQMGWSPEAFLAFVQSDKAEQLYAAGNKEAQERGVFGVPIMMVGDEMWWGNDRLDFLEEYLVAHPAN
jgi:2-hydroxychromene-2-carboxylate isomerase